ncbi:hypothetical protein [Granulicella tundricola]|uniref:NHL repeat containing protein n=1 Tax=Granulicella tundricola (strain ATCC BAA-1859 / DSM 23138 / MP5ACTX9) TaxID=1198114 RepID=E8X335_GRATM|nr:hypothetical protein [Granulicella tundricola]ADW69259.1 hypothetical protein AciX9_2216 [Granulicella tundricola MP5ACTX9]
MKTVVGALALGVTFFSVAPLLSQTPSFYLVPDDVRAQYQRPGVVPYASTAVPGTSAAKPFMSFDIISFDQRTQLMTLSSRSSKAVAIFDGLTGIPIGETPAVFAGVGASNDISGPNGNVIAGDQLWAGDYPSTVRVFDLRANPSNPPQIAVIDTGGTQRADEMDYDPADGLVAVSNGDTAPAFVTLISTKTLKIVKRITFDGSHGTVNASPGGIGSVLFDKNIGKFLISIPQIGDKTDLGAVAVIDPKSGTVEKIFKHIDRCMAAGMAKGPGDNVLIGCDPGFPAPDATFTPLTYVINDKTGAIVARIKEVGGEDEVWYNPGNHRYYTGSRDFFTNAAATKATPVLGVINADTNQWIENVPTGTNAHSVTANPFTNAIFVPLEDPNQVCGPIPGCLGIYHTDYFQGW